MSVSNMERIRFNSQDRKAGSERNLERVNAQRAAAEYRERRQGHLI